MATTVTENSARALFMRQCRKIGGNTKVGEQNNIYFLALHGHRIAKLLPNNDLYIRSAGWETKTTKERLNGLPGVDIYQKNYVWYLNGVEWKNSDEWVHIR